MKKIFSKWVGPKRDEEFGESIEKLRRYVVVDEKTDVISVFERLRGFIVNGFDGLDPLWDSSKCRLEVGRLGASRPFIYLAPWHTQGWLFECGSHGWVIARAEKIVAKDTFVRSSQAWEAVTLFKAQGESVEDSLRISSSRHDGQLLSFPIYESELRASLDLREGAL